jgi:serine acetyltransferase
MRVGVARSLLTAEATSARSSLRQALREVLDYNFQLGERTLWMASVDWQRSIAKFQRYSRADRLFHIAFCWEWWAVAQYRLYNWAHRRALPGLDRYPSLRRLLFLQQAALLRFCYMTSKIVEGLSGARLAGEAEVGPGLLLMHTGSCGIGVGVRIGANFTMHQDANVMATAREGWTVLGDNVVLYSGARVLGPLNVGDNVRIGANSVVLHDLPSGCLALGAPAKPVGEGEKPQPYPPSALISDLLLTYTEAGSLDEIAPGEYLDRSTGAVITALFGQTPRD